MIHRRLAILLGVAALAAGGAAQAQPAPAKPAASKFLAAGYLDPALVLPPPPAEGSSAAAAELAELHRVQAAQTPERIAQARHDDEHEDVTAIADVLGPAFDLGRFPATARLFADLRNEDSVAAKQAKNYFLRMRPWAADTTLNPPCGKGDAVKSSYPSGHATMGYAAAAVLAQLIPGNAQVVLARSADYAESRLVCGAHYRGDIEGGHVLATALVAKLMTKPDFLAEFNAAQAELTAAHIAP
jgi:acid phosphatase (class A)